jgi:hypothetical protein
LVQLWIPENLISGISCGKAAVGKLKAVWLKQLSAVDSCKNVSFAPETL